jgi:hypothetical protein
LIAKVPFGYGDASKVVVDLFAEAAHVFELSFDGLKLSYQRPKGLTPVADVRFRGGAERDSLLALIRWRRE